MENDKINVYPTAKAECIAYVVKILFIELQLKTGLQ